MTLNGHLDIVKYLKTFTDTIPLGLISFIVSWTSIKFAQFASIARGGIGLTLFVTLGLDLAANFDQIWRHFDQFFN